MVLARVRAQQNNCRAENQHQLAPWGEAAENREDDLAARMQALPWLRTQYPCLQGTSFSLAMAGAGMILLLLLTPSLYPLSKTLPLSCTPSLAFVCLCFVF